MKYQVEGKERVDPKFEDEFWSYFHIQRYEIAIKELKGLKGLILDVGCGFGYGARMLQNSGLLVVGIDRSFLAIRYAQKIMVDRIT